MPRRVWGVLVALVGLVGTVVAPAATAGPPRVANAVTAGDGYVPLAPARLLDTRGGSATVDGIAEGDGPWGGAETRSLPVLGRGGVPATGVDSVVLNLTGIRASRTTYLTVWPTGVARPLASNVNLATGEIAANLVTVKVGTGGSVDIYNSAGTVNMAADIAGWFPTGGSFQSMTPARVMDTRGGGSTIDGQAAGAGAVQGGVTRDLTLAGRAGIPTSGVAAVVLNVTVTRPTVGSYVTVWPKGSTRPTASNLNFPAGATRPNLVVAKLGSGGAVSFHLSTGRADVIVDVAGWIPTGSTFTSLVPARLLDTRGGATIDGQGRGGGALPPAGIRDVKVTGRAGVPESGVAAVVLNITGIGATTTTYLTAYPAGTARPTASNVNLVKADTRPNLAIVKVGTGGIVKLYNSAGSTGVVVDIAGWFASVPTVPVTITSTSPLPDAEVDKAYDQQLQASGGTGPYTWAITAGTLPEGLDLTSGGRITGYPFQNETRTFTVRATDSLGATASKAFTLRATQLPPTITTTTLPTYWVNDFVHHALQATGGAGDYTWTVASGALPPNVTLSPDGTLSGPVSAVGQYAFTARVTDSAGSDTQALTLRVVQMSIDKVLPDPLRYTAYSQQLTVADGSGALSWSVDAGELPVGLTLSPTGVLSGTPTGTGASTFTVRANDAAGHEATRTYTLTVRASTTPVIATTTLPGGQVGVPYEQPMAVSGGQLPYTWSVSAGSLPPGLTQSSSSGVISGTPTATGNFAFTVRVVDSAGAAATRALTIAVTAVADWPMPTRDGTGSNHNPGERTFTPTNVASLQPQWALDASSSTIVRGIIYAIATAPETNGEAALTAWQAGSGNFLWSEPCSNCSDVSVVGSRLIVNATNSIRAYDLATHAVVWDTATAEPGLVHNEMRPAGAARLVSASNAVRAYDVATGSRAWQVFLPSGTSGRVVAANSDVALVITSDNQLRVHAVSNGALRWSAPAESALISGTNAIYSDAGYLKIRPLAAGSTVAVTQPIAGLRSVAAANSDQVYVRFVDSAAEMWGISAHSLATGAQQWRDLGQGIASIALTPQLVWVGWSDTFTFGGNIQVRRANTGEVLVHEPRTYRVVQKPIVANGAVIAGKDVWSFTEPAPSITTKVLPVGHVGQAFQVQLEATGGEAPLRWSLASGTLPAGVSLSATGALSGTPTAGVDVRVTVRVTDARGMSRTKELPLRVDANGVSEWTTLGHDGSRSSYNGAETAVRTSTTSTLHEVWSTAPLPLPGGGTDWRLIDSPVITGGKVYMTAFDGGMAAWNVAGSGVKTPLWTAWPDGVATWLSGVTVSGSTAYAIAADGQLYAFDTATGARRWKSTIGVGAPSRVGPPLVLGTRVYFGGSGGLRAVNVSNGAAAWASPFLPPGRSETWSVDHEASTDGTRIFVGDSCELFALNAATGAVIWQQDIYRPDDNARSCSHQGGFGALTAPVVTGGRAWLGGADGLQAFDAVTGVRVGPRLGQALLGISAVGTGSIVQTPAIGATGNSYIVGLSLADQRTGIRAWTSAEEIGAVPVQAGGAVFAMDPFSGLAYALDVTTGDKLWDVTLPGGGTAGDRNLAVAGGLVLVPDGNGSLHAFAP